MKVYGTLDFAQLQSSASDLLNPATGLTYFNTVSLLPKVYNGTTWKTLASTDSATASTPGLMDTSAQAFNGVKTFNNGIKVNSAAGQDTLSYYDVASGTVAATNFSGGGTVTSGTATVTYKFERIGNVVSYYLNVSGTYTVSANVKAFGMTYPAGFAPTNTQRCGMAVSPAHSSLFVVLADVGAIFFQRHTGYSAALDFGDNMDTSYVSGSYVL